ncbi:oligosaccharide flippase family protein [Rhodoferax sp. U2-2l]|uniref:lipopolysaccharide biosynthesis protein n=1 Tax=Rhodoferax sp. U2-2l TaxID=2884000 RepID=UPI001D0A15A6|nr:oligosaccharide flippase family protein [Rhodoferax sp. U2-2l]MCB8747116.1 oligosaccharide flippase family protein [Rhodoferax sp. U2-2l]
MSLKRNILASYVSQIYVALIGIVMVPLYVKYMGVEAYGLVGFFAMLQAWFQLLDMGLTPTMARETARFNGGASDALSLRRLLRALEGIFVGIALLGGAAMMAGSGAIASSWLKVQQLPLVEVQHAIMLMAVIIALRWVCGLYRGAINGFERLVWLSGFNIAIATARFVLVIPLFIYVGTSPTEFFGYQMVVAVIELAVLAVQTYRLLPKVKASQRTPWQWAPLRGVLKFSLSIAFTSSVWVLVTQTDKLVLSKLLPLADYAYFTLAVILASGVMIVSGPISGAILPRLTKLSAEGDEAGVIRLYRSATQLVGVIAIPVAIMLACFAEQVLWAWTGDAEITRAAAPVLTLYALGNGILAFGAFPYYLQYAKGDLRLHLIGNAMFVVLLIPGLIWATMQYGFIGAGWAWLSANVVYFLVWVPKVHRRFMKGLHVQWLLRDVGMPAILSVISAALVHYLANWPQERVLVAIQIAIIGLSLLTIAATGSAAIRAKISDRWRMRFRGKTSDLLER